MSLCPVDHKQCQCSATRPDPCLAVEALRKDAERLREALERIAALDPSIDSPEGFNEWGEADCFRQAQAIANAAMKEQP